MSHRRCANAAVGLVLLGSATAAAGASDAAKCEAAKLKLTGKYTLCRLTADAKAVRKGTAADYTKCDAELPLLGPLGERFYWSSTTLPNPPVSAMCVDLSNSGSFTVLKTDVMHARAVRGP